MKSMTGFGVGVSSLDGWRVETTMRTLNHRYLSVRIRALGDRPWLQSKIEEHVRRCFARGELGVWVTIARDSSSDSAELFDAEAATRTHRALCRLQQELGIDESPNLGDLQRLGALQPPDEKDEALWPSVRDALDQAIKGTQEAREAEGKVLADELQRLMAVLRDALSQVEARLPEIVSDVRTRLSERVAELEITLDPERLEAEIALLAERYEVQEEIVRLRGHLERAGGLCSSDESVGKELDFISQEMLREVNTIGSKVRDLEVGHLVIDMKVAIEQFKEQIQNVE